MITTAAILSSTTRSAANPAPNSEAPTPSTTKIAEKLRTKRRLGTSTRRLRVRVRSAGATPATVERYPGTSGSTHGERNETAPAATAARTVTPLAGSLEIAATTAKIVDQRRSHKTLQQTLEIVLRRR